MLILFGGFVAGTRTNEAYIGEVDFQNHGIKWT